MLKHRRTALMTISSALLAVAPKCPVCFLAYFGIFGVATTSTSAYRAWLPPITSGWLALTVVALVFQGRGLRRYGPALLGLLAALTILVGRFALNDLALLYVGISALVLAAGWRAWLQTQQAQMICDQCVEVSGASREEKDLKKLPI